MLRSLKRNDAAITGVTNHRWINSLFAALLCCSLVLAIQFGAVSLEGESFFSILGQLFGSSDTADEASRNQLIVFQIRLPRVLLAAVVGAGLGISGAVIQGLFRNPLAEPALIGISSGAALAAALMMVFLSTSLSIQFWLLPLAAFFGGLAMTWLVYLLGRELGDASSSGLLLAGIALNAIAAAVLALISYVADADQLRQVVFWTLGSFTAASWAVTGLTTLLILTAAVYLYRLAVPLNCLLLGEKEAGHLGMNVNAVRKQAVICVAVTVGAAVAAAGIIGFVGLVVPHLVRLLTGPDHRLLLPASALLGATLMVIADLLARLLIAPAELPIGLLTALIGGPFFIWLLLRQQGVKHA